eukprot:1143057-Pelagomonas_calceolata.AAC.5
MSLHCCALVSAPPLAVVRGGLVLGHELLLRRLRVLALVLPLPLRAFCIGLEGVRGRDFRCVSQGNLSCLLSALDSVLMCWPRIHAALGSAWCTCSWLHVVIPFYKGLEKEGLQPGAPAGRHVAQHTSLEVFLALPLYPLPAPVVDFLVPCHRYYRHVIATTGWLNTTGSALPAGSTLTTGCP